MKKNSMVIAGIIGIITLGICFASSPGIQNAVMVNNIVSATNTITVDCTKSIGTVNKYVLGNNVLAHDPSCTTTESWAQNYLGFSDYGAGLWDPSKQDAVQSVIQTATNAGIKILRFPGGCGSHGYLWKNAVKKNRARFKFGLCEFYKVCNELHADAVMTLSYFKDTPQDAADLVAFLNTLYDQKEAGRLKNQTNITYWPGVRADNGYPSPFNVKYFEVGNEVFHGDHRSIASVTPEVYAQRYLQYYDAMKAVDPSVQVGVILDTDQWNQKVIPIIKNKMDFGIMHTYPAPGYGAALEALPVDTLFAMCLGMPALINKPQYQKNLQLLKQYANRDIPLAITEFNGGFFMRSPIPYQYTLGNALINAELLRIFMQPENHIIFANNWNLVNENWGMAYNGFYNTADKLGNPYAQRPNYYVFELYHKHFGDYLLNTAVKSETYQEQGYLIDYITVNASINKDQNKVYLMIINKNLKNKMSVKITLTGFNTVSKADAWILNGPDYLSLNENNIETVGVRHVNLTSTTVELEPHSLTAIEISKQ